jgi:hypothetical protein
MDFKLDTEITDKAHPCCRDLNINSNDSLIVKKYKFNIMVKNCAKFLNDIHVVLVVKPHQDVDFISLKNYVIKQILK